MFRIVRGAPCLPVLDLSSRRAALAGFRDDVAEVPGLTGVTTALDKVLLEIDRAEKRSKPVLAAASLHQCRLKPLQLKPRR